MCSSAQNILPIYKRILLRPVRMHQSVSYAVGARGLFVWNTSEHEMRKEKEGRENTKHNDYASRSHCSESQSR